MRLIAFYLPQFHPIPENDAWWGAGFTEWTNVTKARPLFPGHYQPHLPADLGFYDLRRPDVRQAQADLAREYGIHGFCYYHYWFHGRRLLERPFNEVLQSGRPDFPFCLCWANESWTRRWDGRDQDVLQPQGYGDADDRAHIAWLIPALRDPRAITIEGKPIFLVYRGWHLPDPARTIATWRRTVAKAGLRGLYVIAVETSLDPGWDATEEGFDAKLLFQPQFGLLRRAARLPVAENRQHLRVHDYQRHWPLLANLDPAPYRRYESVATGWDNSPRTGDAAVVLHGSTAAAYQEWLECAIARARPEPPDHQVVFVNAWNEWAEGAHLEPDLRHGRAYLEATRRALISGPARRHRDAPLPARHLHPPDDDGTPEVLFAEGAVGTAEAPWISLGATYVFRLYAGAERTSLLAEVRVGLVLSTPPRRRGSGSVPFLTATPNPVPAGLGSGTRIEWSAGDSAWGWVYVSEDGGPEQLFAEGARGTAHAPWIADTKRYDFRLYGDAASKPLGPWPGGIGKLFRRAAGESLRLAGARLSRHARGWGRHFNRSPLASVTVTCQGEMLLTATPNPVPVRPGHPACTMLSWSTGDGSPGQVYVHETAGQAGRG